MGTNGLKSTRSLDLVYVDNTSVAVRFGNSDGSFGIVQSIAIGASPRSPRVADFDNDGYADLIEVSASTTDTLFFRGTAQGTFNTSGVSFATGTAVAQTPDAIDFNNDGILDLAYLDFSTDSTIIRLGNGDGTFSFRHSVSLSANPASAAYNDVNGDGYTDLLVTDSTENSASVYLANSDGTFKARISFATGTSPVGLGALNDLNGDGKVDLHVADSSDDTISIMLGNGDGTFKARRSFAVGDNPSNTSRIDVNNDGHIDFVTAGRNDDTLNILLGNGDGTFRARTSMATGDLPSNLIAFRDLNGDGAADIMNYDTTDDTLGIFYANTKSGAVALPTLSLASRNGALKAQARLKTIGDQLSAHRGTIGAFQSRLQTANNVTSASGENFAAARSRITDADVAEESAGLVRTRILQQVSSAILAQANQTPSLALKLLRV